MCPSGRGDLVVGGELVGVHLHGFGSFFHFGLQSRLPCVVADLQADLSTLAANRPENRGAVVSHRSPAPPFVGVAARGVSGVAVGSPFFTGVLEHLVGFNVLILKGSELSVVKSVALKLMATLQQ